MKVMCLGLVLLSASTSSVRAHAGGNEGTDGADDGNHVRQYRTVALSVEGGMNSLASVAGLKGTYFATPQVAIDLGLGVSTTGLRPGIYGRYLFSDGKFAPFVYTGFKYGLGSGGAHITIEDPDTNIPYDVDVKPSPFLDFGLGIDYLAHNGFYLTGAMGWSHLLRNRNYEWVGAEPPSDVDDMVTFVLGSGLAFSLGLGYAF